jgi:hypothetical protein
VLGTSVAATNGALQRARTTLREQLPQQRADWSVADPSEDERVLLERFIDAHGRCDGAALAELMRTDIRVTMKPQPLRYQGEDTH